MPYGFYFDSESCIGCRTCQLACKDAHDLPVGTNRRIVRTFCTGSGFRPRIYHLSLSQVGCDLCADLRVAGELCACVASCPQRALEFGEIDDLRAKHVGEPLADGVAAAPNKDMANRAFVMRVKDCMADPDFDEIIV